MRKLQTIWLAAFILILGCAALSWAQQPVPKKKQTVLNLYITAQDAWKKWQVDPDKINILDVRTSGEYIFVGHAPMAVNIPLRFLSEGVNAVTVRPVMPENKNFIREVEDKFKKTDTIFVMCRSGSRSAASINLMAEAGFKNVYNIIDGFEGSALKDPKSPDNGKRVVNGWKNSGAPWTYKLERGLAYHH